MQNQIRVCGLNVCGLNSKLNSGILDDYIKLYDIFCISESKISVGTNIANFTSFNMDKKPKKYPLPGIHGLHVYVSNHLADSCHQISDNNFYSDLVIWIKVAEQFILGALYIPHENSKYHQIGLYEDLSLDINNIQSKYELPILLVGDFNSRTGSLNDIMMLETQDDILDATTFKHPDVIKTLSSLNMPAKRTNKDTKINNNGRKLIEMCKCLELCVLNGRSGSDINIGNVTCADASTVDYMICTPDLLHKISDFYIDCFDPLLSDKHNPVHASIQLTNRQSNLKVSQNIDETIHKNHKAKCKWDDSKQCEYQISFDEDKIDAILVNICSADSNEITQDTMDNITNGLEDLLLEPAKATGMYKQLNNTGAIKNKKKKCNKPWFNSECNASKKDYQKFKKSLNRPSRDTEKESLKLLSKKHNKLLRKEKRKFEKEFNAKLKTLKSSNPGMYWSLINPRKKNTKVGDITLDTLWTHFSELNKERSNTRENVHENLPQNTNEFINELFSIDEIKNHIISLKKNKSPGADNILNEFIKNCPEKLIYVIVVLFNTVLETGIIPTDWTIGIIKPLYKNKGDINDVNNYRGITLLSCLGKLFTSVLNTRLYSYLTTENIIGSEQVGFRPKHSTLDHIFALQILANFYINDKKRLFCAFVDYSKAFDFIDRAYLWQKVLDSNINGKVLNVIRNMYKNAKSCVSLKKQLIGIFPMSGWCKTR